MSLDLTSLASRLIDLGFALHDHAPHFGSVLHDVLYLYRRTTGHPEPQTERHQYLSLIAYRGTLVEVAAEVYLAPKQTRTPKARAVKAKDAIWTDHQLKGFSPVADTLLRSNAEVIAFCA